MKQILRLIKFCFKIIQLNFSTSSIPFKYFIVVTKSCRSRCVNCHIWREEVDNELSLDEFGILARNISENLYWLNLSGGEPTDRDDLKDIIKSFYDNSPNLTIINFTSNGLNHANLRDTLKYLSTLSVPMVGVNISIDGPPQTHDILRGTPGGFQKAIEAYKILLEFPKIKNSVAMTLFPANQGLVEDTILAIQQHIPQFKVEQLHLNYPHSSSHYYGNERINYRDKISDGNLKKNLKKKFLTSNLISFFEALYQKNLKRYQSYNKTPVSCAAMTSNIYISEKGDVYPCTIWNKKIGSLRENDFNIKKILETKEAVRTINEIKQKKCPNCWTPCEAFPSMITDLKSTITNIL